MNKNSQTLGWVVVNFDNNTMRGIQGWTGIGNSIPLAFASREDAEKVRKWQNNQRHLETHPWPLPAEVLARLQAPANREWLRRMADIEDSCGSVTAGALHLKQDKPMTTWVTSKGEVIPTNKMHIKHLFNAIKKLNIALKSKERKYSEAKDQYESTKNRMNILLEELYNRKKMRVVQNGTKWMVVNGKNELVYSSHDFDDCVQAMNEIVESRDDNKKIFDYGKYRRSIKVQHLYGDDAMASALADGFYKYKTNDRYDIYRHYEIDVLRYVNKVSKNFHEKKIVDIS